MVGCVLSERGLVLQGVHRVPMLPLNLVFLFCIFPDVRWCQCGLNGSVGTNRTKGTADENNHTHRNLISSRDVTGKVGVIRFS